jgi:hypothetical protein
MIFGGSPARPSRRLEKLIRREVFNVDVAKPSYLKWSEVPITFDRKDHPDHVPQPGSYPLVVAPLFKSRRIHEVLMDRGSGINVLYASTLDEMGIPRSSLRPSTAPFHGVVTGIEALPLGQIDLPITFGDVQNFRTETLTFEVVGFSGMYHAILGRLAYAKFMVVTNYTYLKLKIPGPKGIIKAGPTYQRAFKCDVECFQFSEATIRSERLHAEPRSEDQESALVDFLKANLDCMETLRHEGDPERGCQAQVKHQAGIETGETTPSPLQRREVQGDWRGGHEAP